MGISKQVNKMNMSRFTELLNNNTRWYIVCCLSVVLKRRTLADPIQQKQYLKIGENREVNKIIFLDAAIVLAVLKDYIKAMYEDIYKGIPVQQQMFDLMEYITMELDNEEHMLHEIPVTIGRYSGDDIMSSMLYEKYEIPRMFTDDPRITGIKTRSKP